MKDIYIYILYIFQKNEMEQKESQIKKILPKDSIVQDQRAHLVPSKRKKT